MRTSGPMMHKNVWWRRAYANKKIRISQTFFIGL